jgi:integrase
MRPNTYIAADRYLSRHCGPLQKKPVQKITFEDIAPLIRDLVREHGPTSAARARGALATFFAWCMRQAMAKANPVIGSDNPIHGQAPRDRVLNDEEIRVIWKNCLDDDFGKIVRLLLVTACRREEKLQARADLDQRPLAGLIRKILHDATQPKHTEAAA